MPTAQDLFFQNNKPLAVQDSLISDTTLSSGVDSYDLQDLREDKEFNETSERFLNSLGEGETVDELFDNIFNEFHSFLILLFFSKKIFNDSKTYLDDFEFNND